MDDECNSCTFFFNFFTLIALIVVFVILETYPIVPAFKRGFYCDDNSINKPYIEKETISTTTLIVTSAILIIVIATVCEIIKRYRKKQPANPQNAMNMRCIKLPAWICRLLSRMGLIIVGLFMTMVVVDIGKKLIGRLRPHFMAVCQPDTRLYNCSQGYITADVCTNPDEAVVAEARLSFPSGHAAMSSFVAVALALYIEFTVSMPSLFKPLVQYILLCIGLAGALSRIPDYYHHWSDVLVGLVIGVAHALYVIFHQMRLHHEKTVNNNVDPATTKTATEASRGIPEGVTHQEQELGISNDSDVV